MKIKAAIIGSSNIGTDLMIKILRGAKLLELVAVAGIDPRSDGLATARRHGVATTAEGIGGFLGMPPWNAWAAPGGERRTSSSTRPSRPSSCGTRCSA